MASEQLVKTCRQQCGSLRVLKKLEGALRQLLAEVLATWATDDHGGQEASLQFPSLYVVLFFGLLESFLRNRRSYSYCPG